MRILRSSSSGISSRSEGRPSGPAKSAKRSPSRKELILFDEMPMLCVTMVTVPASGSVSQMVRGMRSPCSSVRTMTNCPGSPEVATRGAFTRISTIEGESSRLEIISNIMFPVSRFLDSRLVNAGVTSSGQCGFMSKSNGLYTAHPTLTPFTRQSYLLTPKYPNQKPKKFFQSERSTSREFSRLAPGRCMA